LDIAGLEESWECAKHVYACLAHLEKASDWYLRGQLWGVLRENDVDCRLLLTGRHVVTSH